MGIPHLSHQLQPHGTKVVLSRTSSDPDAEIPTIVDGPSLAYQCFYVCMSRHSGACNAYEATPSYKELGEAAVLWLEQIEQYGLKVKAIFFDGLLPLSKKPTRLSRLQNYANQLVAFRAIHKEDLPARNAAIHSSKSDLLSPATSSTRLKALPAPSFLVPAVIEALLSSKYKDMTSVIPGEADAYCAESARSIGGTILTSDSDLLVHDLGEQGKVILFRDIESIHLPSRGKCLKVQQYQPASIAEKFGLSNMVRLAYFMTEDNHRSFAGAIKLAKEKNPTSKEFTDFREQYASLPVLSTLAHEYLSHSSRPVFSLLSRLDPRIAELIHQISIKDNTSSANSDKVLNMYLPFLIDDPTRTSAWRAGADIRTLAYSTLRLLDPSIRVISEYERKGTRISDTVATLHQPLDKLQTLLTQFTESVKIGLQNKNCSPITNWRALAAKILCQSNLDSCKATPSTQDLVRLVSRHRNGGLGWSYIQAAAQMHAVLYSLRLLLQISQVVLAFLDEDGRRDGPGPGPGTGPSVLREMVGVLGGLPWLADLHDDVVDGDDVSGGGGGGSEAEAVRTAVADILQDLGVEEGSEHVNGGGKAKKSKKKKRKNKEGHAAETSPLVWRSNNPFGSLSQ